MATHSSVLAWRIPGMGKPGGLPPMESHRVGHNWSNLAAAVAAAEDLMDQLFLITYSEYNLNWVVKWRDCISLKGKVKNCVDFRHRLTKAPFVIYSIQAHSMCWLCSYSGFPQGYTWTASSSQGWGFQKQLEPQRKKGKSKNTCLLPFIQSPTISSSLGRT